MSGAATAGRAVPVLHAIATDDAVGAPDFFPRAHEVMLAGRGRVAVHLRLRTTATRSAFIAAEYLAELQRTTGAWLVVNDRVDVACAAEAWGAQLASHSMALADARRVAPSLAFGVSVHAADEAAAARDGEAAWCLAGHVFATPSHPGAAPRGTAWLGDVVRAAEGLPVIAIGGIDPATAGMARAAGAAGVAAIRSVWGAADAGRAVEGMLEAFGAP